MGLTYNSFTTSLANMIVVPVTDPAYVTALPNIIDDAEQRLYRELDLLATRATATGTHPNVTGSDEVAAALTAIIN